MLQKRVEISFQWNGTDVKQLVLLGCIMNDITDIDAYWGEFIGINGVVYQYQLYWDSGRVGIFIKDGVNPIDYVNSFNVRFSVNY